MFNKTAQDVLQLARDFDMVIARNTSTIFIEKLLHLLDQELISYRYSSYCCCSFSCCWGETIQKNL